MTGVNKAALQQAIQRNQSASLLPQPVNPGRAKPTGNDRPRCSTGKARFATEQEARARLGEIHESQTGRPYIPVNVCSCHKCGGFHLTSKEGKTWKKGKQRHNRKV